MSAQTINPILSNELYTQYNWFKQNFPPIIKQACVEFFPKLDISLLAISKNITPFSDKDFYFVTKIKIDKQYDMFFRLSEHTIKLMLEAALGKSNGKFDLNKLTDLEAKIITSFNAYMCNLCEGLLIQPPVNELRRTNFDMINLVFIVKNTENNNCGKCIISVPQALLNPETITSTGEKFDNMLFESSGLNVKLKIGTTQFTLHELKTLDVEDFVIFENSNIKKMTLIIDDYEKEVNLNPNFGLVTSVDNNGGNNMGADNIWDSIEVEMIAEFDSVKITLGDLKNIEEGNVVDLTSIYNNKVTLKVEDKPIAKGELVIVNDRYGIKVDEIIANASEKAEEIADESDEIIEDEEENTEEQTKNPQTTEDEKLDNEEFDYSDFELDDEDI